MASYVKPVGPLDAKIALIGEAPGRQEDQQGKPFVGGAGKVLDKLLQDAQIARQRIWITNVVKERPPDNSMEGFYYDPPDCTQPKPELIEWWEVLFEELNQLKDCNVYVPLGNHALFALMGFRLISKRRGSVYRSGENTGEKKVIPTFHPSYILHGQYHYRPVVAKDLKLIVQESRNNVITRPKRKLVINPTYEKLWQFANSAFDNQEPLSFDIESNKKTKELICTGVSNDPGYALSVANTDESGMMIIKDLLESDIPKIAQNATFDIVVLEHHGISVKNIWMDTMLAHHTLWEELDHDLAFLTSQYTREPYYKDEGQYYPDLDALMEYNCKDAAVTTEVAQSIERELKELGMHKFFFEHVMPQIKPAIRMELRGVCANKKRLDRAALETEAEFWQTLEEQDKAVGFEMNPNSPNQVAEYIYDIKGYKKARIFARRGKRSTEADVLEAMQALYKDEGLGYVLKCRKLRKLVGTYLKDGLIDSDGRVHSRWRVGGSGYGRWSCSKPTMGEGINLQTVPEGTARSVFIPRPGHKLLNADLKQAEAMAVAFFAREEALMESFREGGDIHRRNAAVIYQKEEEDVTHEERFQAKRCVHGANYGLGSAKLAAILGLPEAQAKRVLSLYFGAFPRIKVWHIEIQEILQATRTLTNPFGRKHFFLGMLDDKTYRSAYSMLPQSTVADIVHKALNEIDEELQDLGADVVIQGHDSFMTDAPKEVLGECAKLIQEAMTMTLRMPAGDMTIPVELKVGDNWDSLEDITVEELIG